MPLGQRIRLFLLYYVVTWGGLIFATLVNFFGAQATLLDEKISHTFNLNLTQADRLEVWWVILIVIIASLLPSLILLTFRNKMSLVLISFLLVLSVIGWWVAYQQFGLNFPFFYTLSSFGVGLLVGIFLKMIYSSTEKDFLRAAFTQFVSEDMLKELLKDPNKLRLTGKEHEVTVMFLDIRGFTAFSEKKSPAIVVNRLNELLDIVTHLIIKHDGTVDKYIGDAVMAVWGAPTADKKQATKD